MFDLSNLQFPLHWAAICGDVGTIEELLVKNWDPNSVDEFRVRSPSTRCHISCFRTLLCMVLLWMVKQQLSFSCLRREGICLREICIKILLSTKLSSVTTLRLALCNSWWQHKKVFPPLFLNSSYIRPTTGSARCWSVPATWCPRSSKSVRSVSGHGVSKLRSWESRS